jgi:hypothetical protein
MKPPNQNDGSRASWLELGQHAAGEKSLPGDKLDAVRLAALEEERGKTPAFDWVALLAASNRVEEPRPVPAPLPWYRQLWGHMLLLVPVFALLMAVFLLPDSGNRTKGGQPDLDFYLLRDAEVYPGDPSGVYRAGDQIQFRYRAAGAESLVLLSIDAEGKTTVFYPAVGEEPYPVDPADSHMLPDSILLDNAPGPEYFIAFFDGSKVSEANASVERIWKEQGEEGIQALALQPGIALVVLERE